MTTAPTPAARAKPRRARPARRLEQLSLPLDAADKQRPAPPQARPAAYITDAAADPFRKP